MITKKTNNTSIDHHLYLKKYPNIEKSSTYSETSDTVQDTAPECNTNQKAQLKVNQPVPAEKVQKQHKQKQKKQDANALSSYLKEIRKWPIFCKEEEQYFAKALEECECRKGILSERWAETYIKIIDWKNLHKTLFRNTYDIPDKKLLKLIKQLEKMR